jgi:hypothetical protein
MWNTAAILNVNSPLSRHCQPLVRYAAGVCGLCVFSDIASGKDRLVHVMTQAYIVENGTANLRTKVGMRFAEHRLSLNTFAHTRSVAEGQQLELMRAFSESIRATSLSKRSYFFKVTMNTYPEHWHLHAYFPPLHARPIQPTPILRSALDANDALRLLTKCRDALQLRAADWSVL